MEIPLGFHCVLRFFNKMREAGQLQKNRINYYYYLIMKKCFQKQFSFFFCLHWKLELSELMLPLLFPFCTRSGHYVINSSCLKATSSSSSLFYGENTLKANGEGGDKRVTSDSLNNMPFALLSDLRQLGQSFSVNSKNSFSATIFYDTIARRIDVFAHWHYLCTYSIHGRTHLFDRCEMTEMVTALYELNNSSIWKQMALF